MFFLYQYPRVKLFAVICSRTKIFSCDLWTQLGVYFLLNDLFLPLFVPSGIPNPTLIWAGEIKAENKLFTFIGIGIYSIKHKALYYSSENHSSNFYSKIFEILRRCCVQSEQERCWISRCKKYNSFCYKKSVVHLVYVMIL